MIPLNHIPGLFLATTFTFGGMIALFSPHRAMREFGLPSNIIASPEAQAVMTVYASRATMFGFALYTFYYQGKYEEMDLVLLLHAYGTVVDFYVCWKEGAKRTALWRVSAGLVVGAMGWYGITAGH